MNNLNNIINDMSKRQILVIGDIMLDRYLLSDTMRMSPETPTSVFNIVDEFTVPGGASNVANNINRLGGGVFLIGITGDDRNSFDAINCLTRHNINPELILTVPNRKTTCKTRVMHQGQTILRLDDETCDNIDSSLANRIINQAQNIIPCIDAVIWSDYNKGITTPQLTNAILKICERYKKPMLANPKPSNIRLFSGLEVISLNKLETEQASGIAITDSNSLNKAGRQLYDQLQPKALIITMGADGIKTITRTTISDIPGISVEVRDVAGAGDTVISLLALAIAAGADINEASFIANCGAAAVVSKDGVATINKFELHAEVLNYEQDN